MKTIKDFKTYLDEIDKLSKPLSSKQKRELENVLKVVLSLLICMKRDSGLGDLLFSWQK